MIGCTEAYYQGKTGISLKSIQNILDVHKELNARWLLTGEGEMYDSQTASNSHHETKDRIILELERIIEAKGEINDQSIKKKRLGKSTLS